MEDFFKAMYDGYANFCEEADAFIERQKDYQKQLNNKN